MLNKNKCKTNVNLHWQSSPQTDQTWHPAHHTVLEHPPLAPASLT